MGKSNFYISTVNQLGAIQEQL